MALIEKSGLTKSKWHPNLGACNLLMSRVMLYQKKWSDVITYANNVITSYSIHYTKLYEFIALKMLIFLRLKNIWLKIILHQKATYKILHLKSNAVIVITTYRNNFV